MAVYKIKDIEVLTGIKAHTIRIWEKRYGILKPSRTDTHIRSYTDDELLLLLNISLLNKYGIKISHIAAMSEKEILSKAKELSHDSLNDTAIEQLIVSLIEMDEHLFRSLMDDLVNEHGMLLTYQLFVIPFLERIGVMWMVGTINPAQEHFISNLIRQKLIFEIELLPTPAQKENKTILFLPEHEWHELSLLLYHYALRSKGIPTVYLGQSLPFDALLESIQLIQPKNIITSWLTAVDSNYILHYFSRLLKETSANIICGGYQILQHEQQLPPGISVFRNMNELEQLL